MKTQDNEPEFDPFLCRCGKCKKFWSDNFNKNCEGVLEKAPEERQQTSGCLFQSVKAREKHPAIIKLGDRVVVRDQYKGTVKYVGPLSGDCVRAELYVGVHLDDQVSSVHNGVMNDRRYFHCPRGHGMMVKYGEVIRINPAVKKPPLKGNYMFPSFQQIKEQRRARSLLDPEFDLGPMYTARRKDQKQSTDQVTDRKDVRHKDARSAQTQSSVTYDYEQDPPRDLLNRWSKEYFGGSKEGDVKARTLYKLHAAYQQGAEYKRREDRGDLTSSGDEDDSQGDDNTPHRSKSRVKPQARSKKIQHQKTK